MKASQNTLDAVADIDQVRTQGDLRRIVANALLALVRKEISATDVTALAKGVDAISNSINTEISLAKIKAELRDQASNLGPQVHLGAALIGNPVDKNAGMQ